MSGQQPPHKELPSTSSTTTATKGITRRGFLKGAGITAAGTALLDGVQGLQQEAHATTPKAVKEYGPEPFPVTLHINGKEHDRHQGQLRPRRLFKLHRLAGQDAREQLHDPRC
jgi:hypothetical protein